MRYTIIDIDGDRQLEAYELDSETMPEKFVGYIEINSNAETEAEAILHNAGIKTNGFIIGDMLFAALTSHGA